MFRPPQQGRVTGCMTQYRSLADRSLVTHQLHAKRNEIPTVTHYVYIGIDQPRESWPGRW